MPNSVQQILEQKLSYSYVATISNNEPAYNSRAYGAHAALNGCLMIMREAKP